MLLTVWPGIYLRHRPDLERRLSSRDLRLDPSTANEEFAEYKWPYMNVEDLSRPNALLIFLNSRGRRPPSAFAYSDLELSPMLKLRKEFLDKRPLNVTMNFLGRTSPHTYGEFIEWFDVSAASSSIQAGRSVHVDHGMQILEIHDGVMEFLSRCIGAILPDRQELMQDYQAQTEPPSLSMNNTNNPHLNVVSRDEPYRVPANLYSSRLRALASARKRQAMDHVTGLREDPG